ncbi:hypothetical protein nbrc107696_25760 [Gordonia spumicola]|uniref:DUF2550 domain-containing protein n=2 Tax=Gordonia spumicola TaxID=589161 RepID=A0A7I9VAN4_9ACTN|nr:hypothetical protein nbrc107696_25760 [Gordonia spumicola]
MPVWSWILCLVVLAGAAVLALVAYRLRLVRAAGTPMLLRQLPAEADEGWRHGAAHYTDDALVYYRLSSLRPGPTVSLSRRRIEVTGRRGPSGTEVEIMDDDVVVVELTVGRRGQGGMYEIALTPDLAMAFQSWIEARAPRRARRRPAA